MAPLELAGLTHARRDGTRVVDSVDLAVAAGELVALLGPPGAGKSTLLRMLLGLADITAGELRLDGERADDWAPAERDLAMVHQDPAPYPHLTVRDNVAFPLRLAGLPAGEVGRRVAEVAAALELTVHLDRRPSQLSGGQRQRVALARALVRRPRAYLLDEPLSQAPPGRRGRLRTAVTRWQAATGTATLWATRDPAEAMALGGRVAVLRRGRLEQVAPAQEVYDRPATLAVAALTGAGPLNVLPARVAGDALRLPVGELPLDPAAVGRLGGREEVLAAVRPEHVEEAAAGAGRPGLRFTLPVEGSEWTGAELQVRLRLPRGRLPAVAAEVAPPEAVLVARLRGEEARDLRVLAGWVDARRVLLFDARTGAALTAGG